MLKRLLYKIGLTFTLAVITGCLHAQEAVVVSVNFGYATFSGGDAKAYNSAILKQMEPVPLKVISNYPGYYMYSGKISMFLGRHAHMVSLYGGHSSTGSRLSYVDYSGFFYVDQRVTTTSLGAEFATPFVTGSSYKILAGIRYLANFNALRFNTEVQTPVNYDHVELAFRNVTHGFQPTLYFMKSIKFLVGSVELGYEFQIPQKLFLERNSDTYFVDDNGDPIKYSGSGVRVQVGLGFRLAAASKAE